MIPPRELVPPWRVVIALAAALVTAGVLLAHATAAHANPRVVGNASAGSTVALAPGPRPARASVRRVRWQVASGASGAWTTVSGATALRWIVPGTLGPSRIRACVRWSPRARWRCSAAVDIRSAVVAMPAPFAGPVAPAPPAGTPQAGDAAPPTAAPSIAYGTTQVSTPGQSFPAQVTGGSGTLRFSYSGTLPPGVSFDDATGAFTAPPADEWTIEVSAIAGGDAHSCALSASGMVWCWGDGSRGQLGSGSTTSTPVPVPVRDPAGTGYLTGVRAVTAGGNFSCAVVEGGGALCWGADGAGQLGDGRTSDALLPVVVRSGGVGSDPLADVIGIDAGDSHACAVVGSVGSARAVCWGTGTDGQLGHGQASSSGTPVGVVGVGGSGRLEGVAQVAAGDVHTCARMSDGAVRCWGQQQWGRLGNGSQLWGIMASPVATSNLGPGGAAGLATGITVGASNSCASVSGAQGRCWGDNRTAQTWDRISSGGLSNPISLPNTTGGMMASGSAFTCAAPVVGTGMRCWGANASGQLGQGTMTSPGVGQATATMNTAGTGALSGVSSVSAGEAHTCSVMADQSALCWGLGTSGQLGDSTTTSSSLPRAVARTGARTGYPAVITVTVTDAAARSSSTQVTLTAG